MIRSRAHRLDCVRARARRNNGSGPAATCLAAVWWVVAGISACGGSGSDGPGSPSGSSGSGAAAGSGGQSGSGAGGSGVTQGGSGNVATTGAGSGVGSASGNSDVDAAAPSSGGDAGGSGASSGSGVSSGDASIGGGQGVEQWHPTVLTFTSTGASANQYLQNAMTAAFTGPGGARLTIPGYFTGGTGWSVRFSPTAIGTWTYTTQSADAGLNGKTGSVTCIANTNPNVHGALRVDAANPTHLKYEDGTPYFQLAYESDWLGLMDLTPSDTPAGHAKVLIDMMAANGFHEVLMNMFAYDTPWGNDAMYDFGPAKAYLWGGTNAAPVHGQINPAYFDRFDAVMDQLFQKGITSHLYFVVSNKMVNWPAMGSPEDDKYFQYVTARYQAYPNIVWDIAKETFHYPASYIQGRAALIKGADAYQRLRTTHAPINGGAPAGANYWFDVKPNNLDFYTAEAVQGASCYSNTRQAMTRIGAFPYANDESSYQVGNDGTATYSRATESAANVHDYVTENIMAGAGAAYYYAYHAWDDIRYNEVPAKIGYFKNLSDVFTNRVALATLAPDDTLIGGGGLGKHCLANPGHQYVVELSASAGTTVSLNVSQPAGGSLAASWYDLDLGTMSPATPATVTAAGTVSFAKPFAGSGILVLK
ncbi:MAG: DUF4038 domain-containing protein [Myxococcota bacterium]|nr:DUF4038 domain-containing protein [Myxococcota bacterium]